MMYCAKTTIDEVKRTAQQQVTRALKEKARLTSFLNLLINFPCLVGGFGQLLICALCRKRLFDIL